VVDSVELVSFCLSSLLPEDLTGVFVTKSAVQSRNINLSVTAGAFLTSLQGESSPDVTAVLRDHATFPNER
jgi:hypothetical protein